MPTSKLLLACLIFAIGQTFGWFQIHSQYVWKWWEGRAIEAVLLFGLPAGLCFWYATKMAIDATDAAWSSRLLGFGMSYVTFPFLTWWLLEESMLTPKTLVCVTLSFMIIGLQLFWK